MIFEDLGNTVFCAVNIWVKPNDLRQDHVWKSWFWSEVIYPFYENTLMKRCMEILKKCHCLYLYYYESWNSFLNVSILKSGIIFESWKSSSNFTQEHCILVILFLKSTFYILRILWPLQRVLCLILPFSLSMKFFCILCKRSIALLWSLVNGKRCITLETAKDLKTVIRPSKVNCLMRYNFKM